MRHSRRRLLQHPLADPLNQPTLFRDPDKHARQHGPARRVIPTNQRFHAGQAASSQTHLRLKMEHELVAAQGRVKIGNSRASRSRSWSLSADVKN